MMITFGQYSILVATHPRITHNQLRLQTEFDELMINYFITALHTNGLITSTRKGPDTCYELTRTGINYLIDYEHHNPALIVPRENPLSSFRQR